MGILVQGSKTHRVFWANGSVCVRTGGGGAREGLRLAGPPLPSLHGVPVRQSSGQVLVDVPGRRCFFGFGTRSRIQGSMWGFLLLFWEVKKTREPKHIITFVFSNFGIKDKKDVGTRTLNSKKRAPIHANSAWAIHGFDSGLLVIIPRALLRLIYSSRV